MGLLGRLRRSIWLFKFGSIERGVIGLYFGSIGEIEKRGVGDLRV
jgi:hypothetical protein